MRPKVCTACPTQLKSFAAPIKAAGKFVVNQIGARNGNEERYALVCWQIFWWSFFFCSSAMGKSLHSGVNQIVVQFLPGLGCIWWGRDRNRVSECDGEDNNWKKYPCSIKYESGYFSIAIWRFIFILFFNWCRDLARASKCRDVESVFR